jgi:hypothetical protein
MPPKSIAQWNKRPVTGLTTGQQIKKKDPERYKAMVRALRQGVAHDTMVIVFETSRDMVNAICEVEKIDPASDQQIINKLTKAQNLCMDALITALEDGTLKGDKAAVPLGIITDKKVQIESKPGQLVEKIKTELTRDHLAGLIKQAQSSTNVIDIEVVAPAEAEVTNIKHK